MKWKIKIKFKKNNCLDIIIIKKIIIKNQLINKYINNLSNNNNCNKL